MPSPPPRRHPVPAELRPSRLIRHVGRALLRRCPNCGGRRLFRRWLLMRDTCPRCHLKLDRGEADYFIGAYTINLVTAELLICAGALAGILATWPEVPWKALQWGLMAAMVPAPILFHPFARVLWLAIDLTFRPVTVNDLAGHGENLPEEGRVPDGALPAFPPGVGAADGDPGG